MSARRNNSERAWSLARPIAVVCDMDGLLVDTERMERRVWYEAARDHGVELTDERFATFALLVLLLTTLGGIVRAYAG